MDQNLKQFVPSEICLSCDVCCRFIDENSIWTPMLTDTDIARLSKNLIRPQWVSKKKRLKTKSYKDIFICPCFVSEKNNCAVYLDRPFDCQLYPFLLSKKDGKVFLGFDIKCLFAKKIQGSDKFKKFISYLVSFLKKKNIKVMIKNNPQIIGDYKDNVIFLEELDFL